MNKFSKLAGTVVAVGILFTWPVTTMVTTAIVAYALMALGIPWAKAHQQ